MNPEQKPSIQNSGEETQDLRTDFQKRMARFSDKQWKLFQIFGGILLGAAVSFFLFGGTSNEIMSMFTLYALVLALVVPKVLKNLCGRTVQTGQLAMVITIAAIMIAYVLIEGMNKGFSLT